MYCCKISCLAVKKCKHRSKCMTLLSLLVLAFITSTTAILSEWTCMCKVFKASPQSAMASTTGTISLAVMFTASHSADQGALNHPDLHRHHAPQLPEASVKMCVSGGRSRWLFSKEIPFHLLRISPTTLGLLWLCGLVLSSHSNWGVNKIGLSIFSGISFQA